MINNKFKLRRGTVRSLRSYLRRLEKKLKNERRPPSTSEKRVSERIRAVLELHQGSPAKRVAARFAASLPSVYRWHNIARKKPHWGGLKQGSLYDHSGRSRVFAKNQKLSAWLERALKRGPQQYGYAQEGWTLPSLRELLLAKTGTKVSLSTLQRELHRWGFTWSGSCYLKTSKGLK